MPNTWSDFAQRARDGVHEPVVRDQLDGIAKIAARLTGTPFAQVCLAAAKAHVLVGEPTSPRARSATMDRCTQRP